MLRKYLPLVLIGSALVFASETTKQEASSPLITCKMLVEKAKVNDFAGYSQLSKTGEKAGIPEKKFHKMHKENMERIKNIQCVEEHVAGDHAVVTAGTGDKKRLIPFVSENGTWKFDPMTYMAFYGGRPHGHKHH